MAGWLPLFAPSSAFNGGKVQVNLNFMGDGDFAFLNAMKTGSIWGWMNNANAPVTPDYIDADGYLSATPINGGIKTPFTVPTQTKRPGNYVIGWTGNGVVSTPSTNSLPIAYTITGISKAANAVVSVSLGSETRLNLKVGQPIQLTGVSGTGWSGVTATWSILAVDTVGLTFTIGLNSSGFSGSPILTSALATNVYTSTLSSGLNGSGRCVVSGPPNGDFTLGVASINSSVDYPKPIYVCHEDDEAALLSGQVFGTKFKQRLVEANYGVIRFLNWQVGNTTNLTTWATRKPTTAVSYNAPQFFQSLYCGTTTNTGNAYSVAAPTGWAGTTGGKPADKQIVHVVIGTSATASGTCSLKITGGAGGNTGDINILNESTGALSTATNSYPEGGTFRSLATLIYDADLDAWIKYGGDTAYNSQGIINGCPIELMVQLCREVGAHPYFVGPPLALDPMTDFIPSLAAYIQSTGPSWMVPRFEGPNELWNFAAGFFQTGYAQAKSTAHWGSPDYYNWYGKILSTLGQAAATVYGIGNLGTKYHVLCGVQTSDAPSNNNTRLTSAAYVAQAAAAQSPYTKTAASGWTSHVANAQYMAPSDYGTGAETTKSNAFAGVRFVASITAGAMTVSSVETSGGSLAIGNTIFGAGIANNALASGVTITGGSAPNWTLSDSGLTLVSNTFYAGTDMTQPGLYADTLNSGSSTFNLAGLITLYSGWKTWAVSLGVNRMCGYEGGWSPQYTPGSPNPPDAVNVLRYAASLVSQLQTYTTTNWNNFVANTGGGFTAEFPSEFEFSGLYPSGDCWSILEDVYQPNPPRTLAAIAYNH